jgi:hypothetical protein
MADRPAVTKAYTFAKASAHILADKPAAVKNKKAEEIILGLYLTFFRMY